MNWEAAINPTPLGILLMPGGVDSAVVLAGALHDKHFDFNVMARFSPIFGAAPSAILRQWTDVEAGA